MNTVYSISELIECLRGINKESDLIRECERRLPMEFAACKSTFEKLVKMQHYFAHRGR